LAQNPTHDGYVLNAKRQSRHPESMRIITVTTPGQSGTPRRPGSRCATNPGRRGIPLCPGVV